MTYSEASKTLQEYTGQPLLESLETIHATMNSEDYSFDPYPKEIVVAYCKLMAGLSEMML